MRLDSVHVSDFPLYDWTQLRWFLDSNVIDAEGAVDLRRLGKLGWVWLSVTDVAHTEPAQNPDFYEQLLPDLASFDVALGPMVLNHSRLGWSITGDNEDQQLLESVYLAIWPSGDYMAARETSSKLGRNRFRDAMHIAWAIRYHGTGFVTEDKALLRAASRVAERFDSFRVVGIAAATERSKHAAHRRRRIAAITGKPDPSTIPDWP